jgi:hypothetical protein
LSGGFDQLRINCHGQPFLAHIVMLTKVILLSNRLKADLPFCLSDVTNTPVESAGSTQVFVEQIERGYLASAMWDFKDKVAVVTGASRGAGRGIALVLGECGATVYVTGRSVRLVPPFKMPDDYPYK